MKYWRGYLVAAIFVAISWALTEFAKAHTVLVDMIYPYITRMVVSTFADWTGGLSFCLWQVFLVGLVAAGIVTIALMIVLRWNPIQWLGWVVATISCIAMLNNVVYGLNEYAGPLADDIRLEVTDYTVSELNDAVVYFRDQANALAGKIKRDDKGNPDFGTFEEMAQKAGEGFEVLTYDEAISVFAGSTAPVKELTWGATKGKSGTIVPLTGEAAVNPNVPTAAMPFSMCKEMARRMAIYSDADAKFAAFLAGIHNSSPEFQYSAYLMAYHYSYAALSSVPTSTAQACATKTSAGVNSLMRQDLEKCQKFFGNEEVATSAGSGSSGERTTGGAASMITFSTYTDVSDLLASWHIQNFVLPLHQEEEEPFNPLDPSQVDLSGIVNAKVN